MSKSKTVLLLIIAFSFRDSGSGGSFASSKEDYLWSVGNNMNGEYYYNTSSEFAFRGTDIKGKLQVEVFLNAKQFDEDDLRSVGLDPDFAIFRTHKHVYTIE